MSTSFPNYKEYLKSKKYNTCEDQSSNAHSGLNSRSHISDNIKQPIDKLIHDLKIKKSQEIITRNSDIAPKSLSLGSESSGSDTLDTSNKKSITYSNYKE